MKKLLAINSFLLLLIAFSGCEIVMDGLGDCIINSRPELSDEEFYYATYNRSYSVSINASIKKDPNDNDYHYSFYVDGLPEGLTYTKVGIRDLKISGRPREKGTFTFEVSVRVESDDPGTSFTFDDDDEAYDDGDTLCKSFNCKTYTITVK